MKKIIAFAIIVSSVACSSTQKKVLVYAKGTATVNEATKTISASDGAGSDEKTLLLTDKEKTTINIETTNGKATIDIPENGYYVVNAKQDTIVGSYQKYGEVKTTKTLMTQAFLKQSIDSLEHLIQGKNISAANRNYFILPMTAVKVTTNMDAFIVGPFHQMTSIEKVEGKQPEVYRFYSVKEIRETINNLVKLTIAEKK
jgi:hypothetical protein